MQVFMLDNMNQRRTATYITMTHINIDEPLLWRSCYKNDSWTPTLFK